MSLLNSGLCSVLVLCPFKIDHCPLTVSPLLIGQYFLEELKFYGSFLTFKHYLWVWSFLFSISSLFSFSHRSMIFRYRWNSLESAVIFNSLFFFLEELKFYGSFLTFRHYLCVWWFSVWILSLFSFGLRSMIFRFRWNSR